VQAVFVFADWTCSRILWVLSQVAANAVQNARHFAVFEQLYFLSHTITISIQEYPMAIINHVNWMLRSLRIEFLYQRNYPLHTHGADEQRSVVGYFFWCVWGGGGLIME
jgi:hypothetical protein